MENQNLAGILNHRGKKLWLRELMPIGTMTQVEEKIVDARCYGKSFFEMNESELRHAVDQIMLRGAAISGCPLPQTEFFAGYIAEELIIFINDFGYKELTFNEILLAIRLNSCGGLSFSSGLGIDPIQFFGTSFNVDYISKVLSNYISIRRQLDRKFQNSIDGYK